MDVEEFQSIKREAEQAIRACERTEGALESLNERLLDEYGCKSLKEARTLIAKWEKELERIEEDLQEREGKFKRKYEAKIS